MKITGQILKENRESKGISIGEVAIATKINNRTLIAMEAGDLENLPPKTFLRGFVRAYATFLDLEVDNILNTFYEEMGTTKPRPNGNTPPPVGADSPIKGPQRTRQSEAADETINPKTSMAVNVGAVAGILFLVILIALLKSKMDGYEKETVVNEIPANIESLKNENSVDLGSNGSSTNSTPPAEVTPTAGSPVPSSSALVVPAATPTPTPTASPSTITSTITSTTTSTTATPLPSPTPQTTATPALKPSPTATAVPASPSPKPTATATPTLKPSATPASAAAAAAAAATPSPKPSATPAATATPTPKPSATPTPKPSVSPTPSPTPAMASPTPAPVTKTEDVIIEALDTVDVEAQIDGEPAKKFKLKADQVQSIKAKRKVILSIGDGGAVNLIVNGKDRGVPGDLGKPTRVELP